MHGAAPTALGILIAIDIPALPGWADVHQAALRAMATRGTCWEAPKGHLTARALIAVALYGTAKAVPFVQSVFPQPVNPCPSFRDPDLTNRLLLTQTLRVQHPETGTTG